MNAATRTNGSDEQRHENDSDVSTSKPSFCRMWFFLIALVADSISSIFLLTPALPWIRDLEGEPRDHYVFSFSLADIGLFAFARILCCSLGLLCSYYKAEIPSEFQFNLYHPNGDKKSQEELELEALEEPFWPWFERFCSRPAFSGEVFAVGTQVFCVVKCLARMNVEIGLYQGLHPSHPVYWLAILLAAVLSTLEASYLETICKLAAQYGQQSLGESSGLLRRITSSLSIPLLAEEETDELAGAEDIEERADPSEERGTTDITGDASYKASWKDLGSTCFPDLHLLLLAFVFLLLAAIAQVYIPRFLGHILDSLENAFGGDNDDDSTRHKNMFEIPGFVENVELLVLASILAGVFSGIRGSIFTVVGGRVNVRLRVQLMDSLLSQDIGFFDVTKTGEITSRLSSDTTLVGDTVCLNINVFLRSLVQAIGVLLFMFLVSWQLSILAFISVPVLTVLSKWYGNFLRSLTKLMQKKLAEGNSVSEAALCSMSTVRAFDAAEIELEDFESCMSNYLALNKKSAFAYLGYSAMTVSLPNLVFAVVVFYGGLLIRNEVMTSGQLVSFLLYLQSLSDSFASMGYVFSALTQAVGAADKVFELMHRRPRMKSPFTSSSRENANLHGRSGILGVEATKTRRQRTLGIRPRSARGEVELDNAQLYYPSRPNRRVLDGLSMKIDPGSVVALVGKSGGGKSSVMSLIQHLYEPSDGRVLFDGHEIHTLSPEWMSRNISIVSQEPTLFARSIKKNIIYGLEGTDNEPTQEAIEEAARLANAHDFIQKMPQKYDTEVGERGVQLSGGQKQRIAIARAIVRKPRVLLLDEATSALDAESEHLVQNAIDDMLDRGKKSTGGAMTVIIVAHRLSTVRNADRIFVIQEGRVVEQGSHDELVQRPDGAYSLLIDRQMQVQRKLDNKNSS